MASFFLGPPLPERSWTPSGWVSGSSFEALRGETAGRPAGSTGRGGAEEEEEDDEDEEDEEEEDEESSEEMGEWLAGAEGAGTLKPF